MGLVETLRGLSDAELLSSLDRVVAIGRRSTAELLVHLAEVESRRLYLEASCSSLFVYCRERLGLDEGAAYVRIRAARVARRFPVVLRMVSDGRLHLAGIAVLAGHLTPDNHRELLASASGRSKRSIEAMLADRAPKPSVPSTIRRLPDRARPAAQQSPLDLGVGSAQASGQDSPPTPPAGPRPTGATPGAERENAAQDGEVASATEGRDPADAGAPAAVTERRDPVDAGAPAATERRDPAVSEAPAGPSERQDPAVSEGPAGPSERQDPVDAGAPASATGRRDPAPGGEVASATERKDPANVGAPAAPTERAAAPDPMSDASPGAAGQTRAPSDGRPERRRRGIVAPLGAGRHRIELTASDALVRKLERARALLSHKLPGGDIAEVIDQALTLLVEHLEKKRYGARRKVGNAGPRRSAAPGAAEATDRRSEPVSEPATHATKTDTAAAPTKREEDGTTHAAGSTTQRTAAATAQRAEAATTQQAAGEDRGPRRVPMRVRREVYERDGARCAHVDAEGRRCTETRTLELDHIEPWARGGPSTVQNVRLLCAAHNRHAARQEFGPAFIARRIERRSGGSAPG